MAFNLMVVIGQVDMNGYWGREHHPVAEDSGQTARVVKFEYVDMDDETDPEYGGPDQVWTVEMPDGRTVEFIGHEIAEVRTERM